MILPDWVDALDLLPGWHDDWAIIERERMRLRILHALEALSRILTHAGWHADAVQAALTAMTLVALNLFAESGGALNDESEHVALLFASHVAVAMAGAEQQGYLQHALTRRDLIGQAKGNADRAVQGHRRPRVRVLVVASQARSARSTTPPKSSSPAVSFPGRTQLAPQRCRAGLSQASGVAPIVCSCPVRSGGTCVGWNHASTRTTSLSSTASTILPDQCPCSSVWSRPGHLGLVLTPVWR